MHGVTEHGEARGHGGEEALVLVLVLVLVGATHLRSLTLKPETPIRRRSEKKGLRSVRERERERWKNKSDFREQRGQEVDRLAMTSRFYFLLLLRKMLTRKGEWCFFSWFLLELCLFF